MSRFLEPLALLFRHRAMLWATTRDLVRRKYIASYLGLFWVVLYPIVFLGLYALIFIAVLQVRVPGHTSVEYVLLIFSGLIPFLGFTEALSSGVSAVVDNKGLIKNIIFPIELVPVQTVLASSITMVVGLPLLVLILAARGQLHSTQLLVPVMLALQLAFTIGLVWLLSMLTVFFRDIATFVPPLILLLMLVSPIAYTTEMIPPELMPFMYPNPLFYMIVIYRDLLFFGRVPWAFAAIFGVLALVIFAVGFSVFARLKGLCSDYL